MEVIYRWIIVILVIVTIFVIGAVVIIILGNKNQWPDDYSGPSAETKRRRFNRAVSRRHQE